jgi:leader peptidase (prepilin peptidase)/N-methyltransferase
MHVYPTVGPVVAPVVAAAVWGTATGLALPRAAFRLAVEPEEPWRTAAPDGTPYPAGVRGWTGWGPARRSGPVYGGVCAGVCAALAASVGGRPELGVWLLIAPVAVLMGAVDLAVSRLPDILTVPVAVGTAALLGVAALLPGHAGSWPRALLGGLVLLLTYLLLHLANPSGMGFGDVKLAPSLGMALAWYGWGALVLGTLLAFGLGAVAALALLALRRAGRSTPVPFGPMMLLGALVAVLLAAAS